MRRLRLAEDPHVLRRIPSEEGLTAQRLADQRVLPCTSNEHLAVKTVPRLWTDLLSGLAPVLDDVLSLDDHITFHSRHPYRFLLISCWIKLETAALAATGLETSGGERLRLQVSTLGSGRVRVLPDLLFASVGLHL